MRFADMFHPRRSAADRELRDELQQLGRVFATPPRAQPQPEVRRSRLFRAGSFDDMAIEPDKET